ncbi:purine-nucleoside phosphorylase [Sinomicrobium weinanense]|uniref:Uridine phosphorylase n=1 Tax=Sinomicrobium weinanense TaxID=2842200 RepID=A0A926Q3T0_9FLAO|nr:purine-nucleoside phosphorylase [Sinomicrobium weinanense]MBC9796331.1 purine-nucleoside phosphorylase [Sinomicrobium weinanense]MBU3122467.1 purine-nucleoside phosphorylase [Sinomicrobium weinanense]
MSLHIRAEKGEIAATVLLPGDPLRAKWIAENFLTETRLYNDVRGMYGFTGMYKGRQISVQGTGMGIPSISIYAHELINDYGARQLIRIGSAGSYQLHIKIRDIVLAMSASTNSNINRIHFNQDSFAPTADPELFLKAVKTAESKGIAVKSGNILTSDIFYDNDPNYYKKWAEYGILGVEMETAALYSIAAKYGVKALAILTVTDHLITGEHITTEERQVSLEEMVTLALGI